jgi:hypothetical protein
MTNSFLSDSVFDHFISLFSPTLVPAVFYADEMHKGFSVAVISHPLPNTNKLKSNDLRIAVKAQSLKNAR